VNRPLKPRELPLHRAERLARELMVAEVSGTPSEVEALARRIAADRGQAALVLQILVKAYAQLAD
jgi:hypothetical protein